MGIEIKGMTPLIQVFDMPTSIAFYRGVLGFEVVTTSRPGEEHFAWALLRLNGVELMLNTAYEDDSRPAKPDPVRISAHDDTAIYFGCPDVDAAYEYLRPRITNLKNPEDRALWNEAAVSPRSRWLQPLFSVARRKAKPLATKDTKVHEGMPLGRPSWSFVPFVVVEFRRPLTG